MAKNNNNRPRYHDDDLAKQIAREINKTVSFKSSNLAQQYERNLKQYLAEPLPGDEDIKGTSLYVSPEVQERVSWFVAQVVRVLDGQKSIASFAPLTGSPQDKAIADQQNKTINHVLREKNSHVALLTPWVQSAALYGLGVVNVSLDANVEEGIPQLIKSVTDEMLVDFVDQEKAGKIIIIEKSDDYKPDVPEIPEELKAQAQQIIGQPIDQSMIEDIMPTVRDLKIRRIKKLPHFKFANVNIEDFIVSPDADFCSQTGGIRASIQGHRTFVAKSDLIDKGYDREMVEDIASASDKADPVAILRAAQTNGSTGISDSEKCEVYEVYTKISIDDGKRRHYRITVAGDIASSPVILDYEEVSKFYPYCALVPFPIAGTLFGQGVADRVGNEQNLITKIFRATLDNLHYHVNPVKVVNVEQTNPDDVLNIYPGSVIRSENPAAGITWQQPAFGGASALPVIAEIKNRLDHLTGVGGQMVSIDASDLQDVTATASKQRTNSQQMLIEQVCRHFADTGYRYLCKVIIDLCTQKPELAEQYIQRLTDNFVPMTIDEWDSDMDVSTNIAFGLMDKDYKNIALQTILTMQQSIGSIATPQNLYATALEIAENTGLHNPQAYFTSPDQIPPPPPQPDPNAGLVQIEQVKAQLRSQSEEAQREYDAWKLRTTNDLERDRMAQDLELKRAEITAKYQADVDIARIQYEQDRSRQDVDWAIAEQEANNQAREREAAMRQQEMQMAQQAMQQPPMPPQGM